MIDYYLNEINGSYMLKSELGRNQYTVRRRYKEERFENVTRAKLSQYFFSKSFGKCITYDILCNVLSHLRVGYILHSELMAV